MSDSSCLAYFPALIIIGNLIYKLYLLFSLSEEKGFPLQRSPQRYVYIEV